MIGLPKVSLFVLGLVVGCSESGDRQAAERVSRDARDSLVAAGGVAEQERPGVEEREDEGAAQSSLAGDYQAVFVPSTDSACAPGAWASETAGVATIEQHGSGYRLAFKDLPVLEGTLNGEHLHLSAKLPDRGITINLYQRGEGRLEGVAGIGFGTGCNVGYDIVATRIPMSVEN